MKFSNYFLIEANKKEKSLIEEDSNFILGAELELCMKNMKDNNDIADFIESKTNIEFDYSYDESIKVDNTEDASIEIQTIPKPWKQFQEDIQVFLDIIKNHGYTNDSCGFHVTMNYRKMTLPNDFGDKLRLSMQDQKVYKHFPSRKDNPFAISRTATDTDYYDKYYNFRIRLDTNQVEFRVIGGKDYEYKWPEIRNLILDYMVKYKKSLLNPEFMKRKKLIDDKKTVYDPAKAYLYAKNILNGRFPEAEPYIAKSPQYAYYYSTYIIKGSFPEAEPHIAKNPEYAYLYALYNKKRRFPEAEPYMIKDVSYAYLYAKNIIKERFHEAEPYIAKSPRCAYLYALNVIKGRFPEAEPYIAKDPEFFDMYKQFIR